MADDHRRRRRTGGQELLAEVGQGKAWREGLCLDERFFHAEDLGENLGGFAGPDERTREDDVDPDACGAQALGHLARAGLALLSEPAGLLAPDAGVGATDGDAVADDVEFHHVSLS